MQTRIRSWRSELLPTSVVLSIAALLGVGCEGGAVEVPDAAPPEDAGPRVRDAGRRADGGCVPECDDKECGPDGCGGVCGHPEGCYGGLECWDGICSKTIFTRPAHLIPNVDGIRTCVGIYADGTLLYELAMPPCGGFVPGPWEPECNTLGDSAVEFQSLTWAPAGSSHQDWFDAGPELSYRVSPYRAVELDAWALEHGRDFLDWCPTEAEIGAGAPTPILTGSIPSYALQPGGAYTWAFVGLAPEADGRPPASCGPSHDAVCGYETLPRLVTFDDDRSPPRDRALIKLRFLHGIPDVGVLDLCHDADPDDDESPLSLLFGDVPYATATPYVEIPPIEAGALTLHVRDPSVGAPGEHCLIADRPDGTSTLLHVSRSPWVYPDTDGDVMLGANQAATLVASGNRAAGEGDPTAITVRAFRDDEWW